MRSAFIVASMILLGGCTSEDPNQGGFLGGLIGLGSGSYEQRVDDQTASWSADDRRYQREVASKNEIAASIRDRHYEVTDLDQQVATLEGDITNLNIEIKALQIKETVTSNELTKAEGKIATLLDDIDGLTAEQEVQELARALDADVADSETKPSVHGEPESDRTIELRAYIVELEEALDALKSAHERHAEETALRGAPTTD